jgi:hypothetical protein
VAGVAVVALAGCRTAPAPSDALAVGDRCTIDRGVAGDDRVPVGLTAADLDAFVRSEAEEKDRQPRFTRRWQLLWDHRAFTVAPGVTARVRRIGADDLEVEFLDGDRKGDRGFVLRGWARRDP